MHNPTANTLENGGLKMKNEVLQFADSIGAVDLSQKLKETEYRVLFKRRNYFYLKDNNYLIIKVSKNKIRPFWGVGKKFIELFDTLTMDGGNYFVVTLVSNRSGWVFSKREINSYIQDGSLSYSEKQEQYKINNYNLKDKNGFASAEAFLAKIKT
jgi:hypothetical protein